MAPRDGIVRYEDLNAVTVVTREGKEGKDMIVALKRAGEMLLVDEKDRELERFKVPYGGQSGRHRRPESPSRRAAVFVGSAPRADSGRS